MLIKINARTEKISINAKLQLVVDYLHLLLQVSQLRAERDGGARAQQQLVALDHHARVAERTGPARRSLEPLRELNVMGNPGELRAQLLLLLVKPDDHPACHPGPSRLAGLSSLTRIVVQHWLIKAASAISETFDRTP